LLRILKVALQGDPVRFMDRLRSFGGWLMRHAAGQMQQLQLELKVDQPLAESDGREAWSILGAALAASGSSSLKILKLEGRRNFDMVLGTWTSALSNLQGLRVHCKRTIRVMPGMEQLASLQQLLLGPCEQLVIGGACLPTSLTSLFLYVNRKADEDPPLFPQASRQRLCAALLQPRLRPNLLCEAKSLPAGSTFHTTSKRNVFSFCFLVELQSP
jgi:hypothetical protein